MSTQCDHQTFESRVLGRCEGKGTFNGKRITSDCGGLLLRETEQMVGVSGSVSNVARSGRTEAPHVPT